MRVSKNTRLPAVRLKNHDAPVFETRVDPAFGVERDVFGLMAVAEWKLLYRRESRVLRVLAHQARRSRRSPGSRRDRDWRKKKICKRDNDDEEDDESEALFESHLKFIARRVTPRPQFPK